MKGKAILKALLLAYVLTGVCLMLLAFLVFTFHFGEGPATVGITVVYVIASLTGGFSAGRMIRKDKYRWGILTGLFYFLLLAAVSFAVQGKWDMSAQHLLTIFCMCIGGGALGGMLA